MNPTLEESVEILRDSPYYLAVLEAVQIEKENAITLLDSDEINTPEKVMKQAGRISSLNVILDNLTPKARVRPPEDVS